MNESPAPPLDCVIVATGVANLASVVAALRRAGAAPRVTHCAREVLEAPAVLLPGVGAFDAGRAALARHDLDCALRTRIAEDRPTLAICLGMQLLFASSDEGTAEGLSILPGHVARFDATRASAGALRVPQLGWNRIDAEPACTVLASGSAWFANSYRLIDAPRGVRVAWSEHGGRFVAGLESGRLVACQFHPELSGSHGAALLRRFVRAAREACPC